MIRTFRDVFRFSRQWMDRVGGWVDGRVGERTSSTQMEGLTCVVESEFMDKRMGPVKTEQLGKEVTEWTDE